MFDNFSGPIASAREGKLRALAVTGAQRNPAAPELPMLADFLPGFDITSWTGVVGPAGLPPAMVARMNALSKRALESEDLKDLIPTRAPRPGGRRRSRSPTIACSNTRSCAR